MTFAKPSICIKYNFQAEFSIINLQFLFDAVYLLIALKNCHSTMFNTTPFIHTLYHTFNLMIHIIVSHLEAIICVQHRRTNFYNIEMSLNFIAPIRH